MIVIARTGLLLLLLACQALILVIVVDAQTSCMQRSYDAFYDLTTKQVTRSPYVTEHSALTGSGCSTQAVLKLTLAKVDDGPARRRVLIDLFYNNSSGWTFHIGDSVTNNGWDGDFTSQIWCAEAQGLDETMSFYHNAYLRKGVSVPGILKGIKRLTLVAGNEHLVWYTDVNNTMNYYYHPQFFGLSGQPDVYGVNYDIYLGLNRVVDGDYRNGNGLCKVGIQFLPEIV